MTMRALAWLSAFLIACGGPSKPNPDPQLGTGTAGLVVAKADGTLAVVQSVPAGAHRVPSADVRLVGLRGNQFAHGTTTADGAFALILASGTADKAAIEVRLDAASTAPDLSFPVTLAADITIPAGAVFAVTRDQAIASILPLSTPAALVAGTFNPLPAGAIVAPAFGDQDSQPSPALAHTVAAEGEYLFLIDPTPTAFWGHLVEYDLVNARTGQVTRMTGENWLPSVNDVMLFSYTDELVSGSDQPLTTGPIEVSGEAIQLPDESMTIPSAARGPHAQAPLVAPDPQDLFGIVIMGTLEDWFLEDGMRMQDWLKAQSVPAGNIVMSMPPLAPNADVMAKVLADFKKVAALVAARKQAGGCPTLFVYVTSHSNKKGQILLASNVISEGLEKLLGTQDFINIDDLVQVHLVPAAAKVRVLIQSCYGAYHVARMKASVEAIPNLATDVEVYTASGVGTASGQSRLHSLIKAFHPGGIPEFLSLINITVYMPSGGDFTARWISGATMDVTGDLNLPSDRFVFNAGDTGPQRYKQAGGPPVIASVTPIAGVAGDMVTISGKNLGGPGANVLFNGVQAAVVGGDSSSIVVMVPASTTGKIEVDGCCPVLSPSPFLYVTSGLFSPTHGLPGTQVAIPGTNLAGTSSFVKFGTHLVDADPGSSDTLVLATVPDGAGDQNSGFLGGSTITLLSGQDVIAVTNGLTGPFGVSANVNFNFTDTNGGANTTVGQTEIHAATIYGAGGGVNGNMASVYPGINPFGALPGNFGTWQFSNLIGTLIGGTFEISGTADQSSSVIMTLSGTIGPTGMGSGDGMVTNQGLTITFNWTTTPR